MGSPLVGEINASEFMSPVFSDIVSESGKRLLSHPDYALIITFTMKNTQAIVVAIKVFDIQRDKLIETDVCI